MMALKLTALLVFLISATDFIDAVLSDTYTYISSTSAYYKLHMRKTTWIGAASTCRSEGTRLFHPDSAYELDLVWRELGVRDHGAIDLFTGLAVDRLGLYGTEYGRPISQVYNKWKPGQPDSCGGACLCGRLNSDSYLLFVGNCDHTHRFICEHEEEVTATDVTTVTADAFRSDYTYISPARAYYKYHKKAATWAHAVSTCRSEGAQLFHPDSAEELELAWRKLAVSGEDHVIVLFTGLSDLDKLWEYKTVDGRPVRQVYNKWGPGEPASWWGMRRCGTIYVSSRQLNLTRCSWTRPFICKREQEVTATNVKAVTAADARSYTTMTV